MPNAKKFCLLLSLVYLDHVLKQKYVISFKIRGIRHNNIWPNTRTMQEWKYSKRRIYFLSQKPFQKPASDKTFFASIHWGI